MPDDQRSLRALGPNILVRWHLNGAKKENTALSTNCKLVAGTTASSFDL